MLVMKLNTALTFVLYFGIAILLHPVKYNSSSVLNFENEKIKTEIKKIPATAKAEVLHGELLFKY